jgi:DNA-directed RNA polymerase specialized sigma24 family protein
VIEIARRERLPVPTVYNWIRLARRDLRAALRREDAAIYVR